MTALRRESFVFPHPSPVVRLSMAEKAFDRLDAIAAEEATS